MRTLRKQPYHQPLLTRHRLPRAVAAKTAGECALLLVCSDAMASDVELKLTKFGTNVVVSWPASATNLALEASASLTNGWTPVTNAPATNQQVVSVTLPAKGPQQFFRLKEAWADKDPNEKTKEVEKDPTIDKDPGEKDNEGKTPSLT